MATSVTQHGITATFGSDLTVGTYLDGSYYVVAPAGVSMTGGTVASAARNIGAAAGRDGIMVNPVPASSSGAMQGYDSRSVGYSSGLNKALSLPFTAMPGDSVIFSESADAALAGGSARSYSSGNTVYLETAVVVTVVATAPAANSFRPQYCSGTKTTYNWSDVDTGLLPGLATVASTPTLASVQAWLERLQLDHGIGWSFRRYHPYQNMHDYGRDIAKDWGDALLMSLLATGTVGDKTTLIRRLVQTGIDLYGVRQAGGTWSADGGHGQGRKAVIMFAGNLLGVDAMRDVGYSTAYQEDGQSFYVTQTDVDTVHLPQRTSYTTDPATADYIVGDIGLAEWGLRHASDRVKDDKSLSATYRSLNAPYWKAHALTIAALGLDDVWGHPAYFEYLSRGDIGNAASTFQTNMFSTYWATYYSAPVAAPRLGVRAILRGA